MRIDSEHKQHAHKTSSSSRRRPRPGKDPESKFKLKINRRLVPIFDRIRVPAPAVFKPDPFQLEALETLNHADVLVTAPTGSGKTYIAIKAIEKLFQTGGRSWYTSPLKALSNAKHEEFCKIFGAENVGILTGDRKENIHAPIIVGTTEILRNQLYDAMYRGEDLLVDLIVLDEAHYLGDEDRGVVWEEVLIYLPTRARLLMLSATIRNGQEICDWLEWLRQKPCAWVTANERPVPLYPLFLFPTGELSPLGNRRGLYGRIRTIDPRSFSRRDFLEVARLMEVLRETNLLPAIFFLKSRADCEKAITLCPRLDKGERDREESAAFFARVEELLQTYPFLRQHKDLAILKKARVGAHHGGQLPHWKLFLEKLMQEGHLQAIFSTSTVAAGVNFPARTVVVAQSDRFNGREFLPLSATDLLQMTGRAGRRGMDEIGFVLVVPGSYQDPQLVFDLLHSPPDAIQSQIRVNFSMVLNLLLSHTPEEIRTLFAASLATHQNLNRNPEFAKELQAVRKELEPWLPEMACGSIERMVKVRERFAAIQEQLQRARRHWKKQATGPASQGALGPGRTFRNHRGVVFVAVSSADPQKETVEAVRVALPVHSRKDQVRTYRVPLKRIAELGTVLDYVPDLSYRRKWQALIGELLSQPFQADETARTSNASAIEMINQELTQLIIQKAELPCESCDLHGPCLRATSHPFAALLQTFLHCERQVSSILEELWQSFTRHFQFLQEHGYVDAAGHLTEDGTWASNLRLDQPLLISEGIRKGLFPHDQPELLAALIAPFVMDRDRPGDIQLSTLLWKYPDQAKPYFRMLHGLQPMRDALKSQGFINPTLPFWTVVALYQWAMGESWEELKNISGMAEGDLAMVILRTADHLRQLESLTETHPRLAASAHRAIQLILREPVLIE